MERKQKIICLSRNHMFFIIMMFLIFWVSCTAEAADSKGLVLYGYEQEGKQYVNLAVCIDSDYGEATLFTILTGEEKNYNSAEVMLGDSSYPIEYIGGYNNLFAVWICPELDILQYVDEYKLDFPVKGEPVTAIFMYEENEEYQFGTQQTFLREAAMLREGDAESGYVVSFDKINNNTYCDLLPGVLRNASGKCVGIILEKNIACPLIYDDNIFQGAAGQEEYAKGVYIAAGGIIILILLVVVGIIWSKKRKTRQSQTNTSSVSAFTDSKLPDPPKPPVRVPGPPEPPVRVLRPTEWIDQETRPVTHDIQIPKENLSKNLSLYIKSGYMMGQVYPIGEDTIMIGRDSRCRIKYPKDYAGISNIHASVFRRNGKLYLKDENSSYGTYLKNGVGAKKIEPTQPQELREGSEFYLAEAKNVIQVVNVAIK